MGKKLNKTISVDEYLEPFSPDIRAITHELRGVIAEVLPGVIERVYPGWKLIGYRAVREKKSFYCCYLYPTNEMVTLGFEYGLMLADPHKVLEGNGTQVRFITFRTMGDIKKKKPSVLIHDAAEIAMAEKTRLKNGKFALKKL